MRRTLDGDTLSWTVTGSGGSTWSGTITVNNMSDSGAEVDVFNYLITGRDLVMVRIERNPAFWTAVASHPAVAVALMGLEPRRVGELAAREDMLPLAAAHGGFLFARTDALGFVCELHTLFTPQGWGREVMLAGIEALGVVWLCGYQAVTTFEMEANPRSRPPVTFGFVQAGEWRQTPVGRLRMWILTRAAWEASPAARRRARCLH